jgi:hypothetical protein
MIAVPPQFDRSSARIGQTLGQSRSVVDAMCCTIEVQTGMVERGGLPPNGQIQFWIRIHVGGVVEGERWRPDGRRREYRGEGRPGICARTVPNGMPPLLWGCAIFASWWISAMWVGYSPLPTVYAVILTSA